MERNEISIHECRVFAPLIKNKVWTTNKDISSETGIPIRTVTDKTKKFVDMGICDLAEVFPSHRYRISEKADKRNKSYCIRLTEALDVFGIK